LATAGAVLGIDPSNQPNVQESKDITRAAARPATSPAASSRKEMPGGDGARLAFPVGDAGLPAALREFLAAGFGRRLRRPAGVHRAGRGRLGPACRRCACSCATASGSPTKPWVTARASPAIPPASSTRAGATGVCSCSCWGHEPRRCRDSGPAVQLSVLKRAQARGRPGGLAHHGVPCPARVPRRRRAGGPHPFGRAGRRGASRGRIPPRCGPGRTRRS